MERYDSLWITYSTYSLPHCRLNWCKTLKPDVSYIRILYYRCYLMIFFDVRQRSLITIIGV